jgi:hypothetical protein
VVAAAACSTTSTSTSSTSGAAAIAVVEKQHEPKRAKNFMVSIVCWFLARDELGDVYNGAQLLQFIGRMCRRAVLVLPLRFIGAMNFISAVTFINQRFTPSLFFSSLEPMLINI